MEIIKALLAILTMAIFVKSYFKNKDLFSPAKVYVYYSVFFYLGIYFSKIEPLTLFCYATLIISIAICSFLELRRLNGTRFIAFPERSRLYVSIWLLSLPGILVKLYLIRQAGGISQYIFNLAFRVQDWAGMGYLVIWFYMLPAIHLVYFSAMITERKNNRRQKISYFLHFCVTISIGLLTGSRSYVAIIILGMLFLYSYLIRPLSIRWAIVGAASLIFIAGAIGALRNNFGSSDGGNFWETATSVNKFESKQVNYGIIPLEIIFKSDERPLQYGLTYLSLLTNFVPRSIYPDKPDTGGIVFTKLYAGNQWGGLSNLATGAITEAIVNFGPAIGIFVGASLNLLVFVWACLFYNKIINRNGVTIFHVVSYYYIIIAAARFSFSEFTNIIQSTFFYALLPCLILSQLSAVRLNIAGRLSYK